MSYDFEAEAEGASPECRQLHVLQRVMANEANEANSRASHNKSQHLSTQKQACTIEEIQSYAGRLDKLPHKAPLIHN